MSDIQQTRSKHHQAVHQLVLAATGVSVLMLLGMVFDVWWLIFYPIPVLIMIFMLLGSTNRAGSFRGVMPGILAYCAVLLLLFVPMGFLQNADLRLFGLQISMGLMLYVVWPFTVLTSGALYAWVYTTWLARDHQER